MKKRIPAFVTCLVLMVVLLASGCSNGKNATSETPDKDNSAVSETEKETLTGIVTDIDTDSKQITIAEMTGNSEASSGTNAMPGGFNGSFGGELPEGTERPTDMPEGFSGNFDGEVPEGTEQPENLPEGFSGYFNGEVPEGTEQPADMPEGFSGFFNAEVPEGMEQPSDMPDGFISGFSGEVPEGVEIPENRPEGGEGQMPGGFNGFPGKQEGTDGNTSATASVQISDTGKTYNVTSSTVIKDENGNKISLDSLDKNAIVQYTVDGDNILTISVTNVSF